MCVHVVGMQGRIQGGGWGGLRLLVLSVICFFFMEFHTSVSVVILRLFVFIEDTRVKDVNSSLLASLAIDCSLRACL